MSDEKIKEGDIVQLRPGGPQMVVKRISQGLIECRWFDADGALHEEHFHSHELKKIEPGKLEGYA